MNKFGYRMHRCIGSVFFSLALSAHAQERMLPAIGGPGGGDFVARCPPGQLLAGVEIRAGDDIDAIRPLCAKPRAVVEMVPIGPGEPGYLEYRSWQEFRRRVSYKYDEVTTPTGWYGGTGGNVRRIACPQPAYERNEAGMVMAFAAEIEGVDTVTVNSLAFQCEPAFGHGDPALANAARGLTRPEGRFQPSWGQGPEQFRAPYNRDAWAEHDEGISTCPEFPTYAVGIHGRAGKWLDAIGIICDYVETPKIPVALGRVVVDPSLPPANLAPGEPKLCAYARSARARNSPAAPGLEKQCQAALAAKPAVHLGRVKVDPDPSIQTELTSDAPVGATNPAREAVGNAVPIQQAPESKADLSICAYARAARAVGSPAAADLEKRCRNAGGIP